MKPPHHRSTHVAKGGERPDRAAASRLQQTRESGHPCAVQQLPCPALLRAGSCHSLQTHDSTFESKDAALRKTSCSPAKGGQGPPMLRLKAGERPTIHYTISTAPERFQKADILIREDCQCPNPLSSVTKCGQVDIQASA